MLLAVAMLMLAPRGLFAQQFNSGEITGFALDTSNAAIPGATILAVETGTGLERKVISDANGYFVFPDLPLGTYNVRAEHTGFKRVVETGLLLEASGKLSVSLKLPVGNVTDSVEVKAASSPVQSETAQVANVIDTQQMMEIPIFGRNMGNMLMWETGTSNLRQPNNNAGSDNFGIRRFSINGSNDSQTHVTVDGVEAIRTDGRGATIGMTSPDALQEVMIITSNYLAEYGRGGGAQEIYVTKSGTRQFHGSAFEFLQNNVLDDRTLFQASVPALRQNAFGGTLGGPVYIPHIWNTQRNKAFFFVSNETLLIRNYTQAIGEVPTAAERAGNFAGSGTPAPIDPLSGLPFPGAIIPASRFSHNGPGLFSLYPAANANLPGGNYSGFAPNWTNQPSTQMKFDYNAGLTHISASINDTHLDFGNGFRGSFPLLPDLQHRYGYRDGLNVTTTIRPTLLNEFQFGYSTDHEQLLRVGAGVDRSVYGIDFPYVYPASGKEGNKIPTLNVSGMSLLDGGMYLYAGHRGPIFTGRDNLTWVWRAHTFKFGGVIERAGLNTSDLNYGDQNGSFAFAASSLNPNTSKNPLADVLLGNFDTYTEQGTPVFDVFRSTAIEGFAQDSWKVRRNLTLELGIRYNFWPHFYETCNAVSFFSPQYYSAANAPQVNPSNGAIIAGTGSPYNGIVIPGSGWPKGCGRVPFSTNPPSASLFHNLPQGFVPTQFDLIDPRIGFSWAPIHDTVIRGGAGVFHTRDVFYSTVSSGVNYPLTETATINYGNVDNPSGGKTPASFPPAVNLFAPNFKSPVLYQFSLGIQRALPANVLLDVKYVGQQTRDLFYSQPIGALPYNYCFNHLPTNCNALQPYLGYSSVTEIGNRQFEDYNSLQTSARRRFSKGLLVVGNYTWSKNLERGSVRDPFNLDLDIGPSATNRTHVANVTFIYELPFWKESHYVMQRMAAGWQVSGFGAFATGLPMNVGIIGNLAAASGTATRPDLVGNPNVVGSQGYLYNYWNTAAFAQPAFGTLGNAGYDILTGPGNNNWDLALMKNFHISQASEGTRIQFRAEMFNAFNHTQVAYNGVNTTWGSPLFGHVTGMAAARVVQFAMKFYF